MTLLPASLGKIQPAVCTRSAVLKQRAGISPAMACRLCKAFDTSPEFWGNLQMQYDLWQARETDLSDVLRLVPA